MIIRITLNKHSKSAERQVCAHKCQTTDGYVLHAGSIKQSMFQLKGIAHHRQSNLLPKTVIEKRRLLTVKELCGLLNISDRKSRRLRTMGKLPFIKQGHKVFFEPRSVIEAFKSTNK
ncbi:DNA binding domain-containing protein, excisionase family [Mucilaginibacter gossypiicola]|uniref:DNA binding domain-containing protein, excisionase family n=1 Tax=Mucilaginibacter gossypiicola TaxID=551995 RepID=A0A1H8UZB6_9SPHI|nr:helix-turn-helix domain-containing protein [Mucilaginibacter gossypiicola]SEP08516.1 DNA binding domain-containing protein, excisionase family [Mucilaginibacter gossypiicola]